jgi:hypothetical protein
MVPLGSDYLIFLHDYRLRDALIAEANARRISGDRFNGHRSLIDLLRGLFARANARLTILGAPKYASRHPWAALSRD